MDYVKIGTIIKTRGLDGTVKIYSTSDFRSQRLAPGSRVYFYDVTKQEHLPFTVQTHQMENELDIVKFKEINDINEAELYLKWEVHVPKRNRDLPKGFYFDDDLIGLDVYGDDGQLIGQVFKIEEYGPYKSLRIQRADDKDVLVPMVATFIQEVNIDKKQILIKLMAGLL